MKYDSVDPRLVAIVDEYIKRGKESELINMLYIILDNVDQEVRKKVYRNRAAEKRKLEAPKRKAAKDRIEAFFNSLSTEELIKLQNTPWEELPDWLKEDLPKLVKWPMENNFVRIYDLVNKEQRQQEISGSRIVRFMERFQIMKTDEEGRKLDYDKMSKLCEDVAKQYDQPWCYGKKAQKVRVTTRDLKNYVQCRVTPKGDKMAVLAETTGMPVWWLSGYLNPAIPEIKPDDPLAPAPAVGRYRKGRTKRA